MCRENSGNLKRKVTKVIELYFEIKCKHRIKFKFQRVNLLSLNDKRVNCEQEE